MDIYKIRQEKIAYTFKRNYVLLIIHRVQIAGLTV